MLDSNYLVVVNAPNEETLLKVLDKADQNRISAVPFFEEDLDNELTAVALQPGNAARKICGAFPLALKDATLNLASGEATCPLGGQRPEGLRTRKADQGSLKAQVVGSNPTVCSRVPTDLTVGDAKAPRVVHINPPILERDEVPA